MFFPDKELTAAARSALDMLVRREESRCGSKTLAYDNVAELIGMSSSWLQKFLRDSGEVGVCAKALRRFAEKYDELCARIEQENEHDAQRLRELKVQADAIARRNDAEDRPEGSSVAARRKALK